MRYVSTQIPLRIMAFMVSYSLAFNAALIIETNSRVGLYARSFPMALQNLKGKHDRLKYTDKSRFPVGPF